MKRLPICDRCQFNTHNPHLFCTVHPAGVEADTCPDFELDPDTEPEELWEPKGASYYNGELIFQPEQRRAFEQRLTLLDWHPLFTGRCPHCEMPFPQNTFPVHWDCAHCGWRDDSV